MRHRCAEIVADVVQVTDVNNTVAIRITRDAEAEKVPSRKAAETNNAADRRQRFLAIDRKAA
ncbi:MAG: hypothetical protein SGJ19_00485 [Planctomycetia bacterium]|nr:hypothetical protein [Planctomycetia bacterium]